MKFKTPYFRELIIGLLGFRSNITAILFTVLLLLKASIVTNNSELLYLEIYNITLVYLIANMLLFARDILKPSSNQIFSRSFIEVSAIIFLAAILIISLYMIKDDSLNDGLPSLLIRIYAIAVIIVSLCISRESLQKIRR